MINPSASWYGKKKRKKRKHAHTRNSKYTCVDSIRWKDFSPTHFPHKRCVRSSPGRIPVALFLPRLGTHFARFSFIYPSRSPRVRSTWKMQSKRYWRLFEQWKASRKNGKYLRRAKFRNEENLKQSCLLCSCYQGTLNDSAKFPFFIFRILRIPFLEFFLPFFHRFFPIFRKKLIERE